MDASEKTCIFQFDKRKEPYMGFWLNIFENSRYEFFFNCSQKVIRYQTPDRSAKLDVSILNR